MTIGAVSKLKGRAASLPRNLWTLERFGLTPSKLPHRLFDRSAPRVLSVSLPKAGTHLLERALCLHPRLYRKILATVWPEALDRWGGLEGLLRTLGPGQVLVAHLPFEPDYPDAMAATDTGALLLVRDPRDIVISQAHYAVTRPDHPFYEAFARCTTLEERIRVAIDGDEQTGLLSVAERLDRYAGWMGAAAFVVRFEDLIGPNGGGDIERQRLAVQGMYRHLGVESDDALVERVCRRLFSGDSPTFRRGSIGGWRSQFDHDLSSRFDTAAGDRLAAYGYER